jgi:HlyD family secretion protein
MQRNGSVRVWVTASVVTVLGGGALLSRVFGGDGAHQVFRTAVESAPITMTVETLGTIEPLSTVTIGCETTGRIVEILVDHDDEVTKDQVICRIDPELVAAQHQQSAAERTRATSALVDAKIRRDEQTANLPVATSQAMGRLQEAEANLLAEAYNWKRVDRLFKEDNATEAEWNATMARHAGAKAAVKIARAAYDLAKNNETFVPQQLEQAVQQAEATLKLAEARFDQTQTQLDRCIIKSPIDGIVLKRYMDVGVTVNAAFQTPPLFLIAPDLDRMRVNAKVSESDIVHIETGQKARFTVEGKQRIEFAGSILHKRNQPETVQGVTTYTVLLEVDNDERRTLLPGMSVNVEIECVHRPDAVCLANKALRFKPPLPIGERQTLLNAATWPDRPLGPDGRPAIYCKKDTVWRYDDDADRWEAVPLWIGITDNVHTEIVSGAESGEEFVIEFIGRSTREFGLKEAIRMAQPDNRTL